MEVKLASNTVSDLAPMPDYLSAEECPRASDQMLLLRVLGRLSSGSTSICLKSVHCLNHEYPAQ